jgi:hypothetical protein
MHLLGLQVKAAPVHVTSWAFVSRLHLYDRLATYDHGGWVCIPFRRVVAASQLRLLCILLAQLSLYCVMGVFVILSLTAL